MMESQGYNSEKALWRLRTTHLGADDGAVDAVVADLDGDLPL